MQTIHLRINDAATGQPTPVRLRVTDAAGRHYAPFGHFAKFPTGAREAVGGDVLIGHERWAYIDGTCEIGLPAGAITVEATKGPEYTPLREKVNLVPGKMALRFAVTRHTDLRTEGWYGGDVRAHEMTPHAARLEAAAEGLAVVHVLAQQMPLLGADGNSYFSVSNLPAYSAQKPCLEGEDAIVCVGTRNVHPTLGKLSLLHTHRIVFPLNFGGADETDDWSLDDWCGQAHRKGGFVVWSAPGDLRTGKGTEALANAILGHVDALEVATGKPADLEVWTLLANAGIQLPLVGASAKDSNRIALGAMRTYSRMPCREEFSPAAWLEGIRSRYSFITSGPFLRFGTEGDIAWAAVNGNATVEIVSGGKVVAKGLGSCEAPFTDGWLAARCWLDGKVAAHSPVFWGYSVDSHAVAILQRHLSAGREWVASVGRFANPKSQVHLTEVFDAAAQRLRDLSRAGGNADT